MTLKQILNEELDRIPAFMKEKEIVKQSIIKRCRVELEKIVSADLLNDFTKENVLSFCSLEDENEDYQHKQVKKIIEQIEGIKKDVEVLLNG